MYLHRRGNAPPDQEIIPMAQHNPINDIMIGSTVKTANGYTGIVHRIDKETYSIPMHIIDITSGKYEGERICVSEMDIKLLEVI